MDVRVFNPFAPSNVNSVSAAYRRHKNTKRHAYGQRIWEIELASFTPIIVMSAAGGLASKATAFYKRLALLLASKWGDEYCLVMGWLQPFFLAFAVSHCMCAWCMF